MRRAARREIGVGGVLLIATALLLPNCVWLDDGDRAAQAEIREKDAQSCVDAKRAQSAVAERDDAIALESLLAIRSRGPQTNPVDRAVELLNSLAAREKRESVLLSKVQHQLENAVELLCLAH